MDGAPSQDRALLAAWLEVSEGVVVLGGADWRVRHVNAAGAALHGLRPEDVVGRRLGEVFPEDAGSQFHRGLRRALEQDDVVSWTGYVRSTRQWLAVRAQRLDGGWGADGTGPVVLCAYRDVTRERHLEAERDALLESLRESLRRTTALLDLSQRLTATTTGQDVTDVVADAARELFGADSAAVSAVDHERRALRSWFSDDTAPAEVTAWSDLQLQATTGRRSPGTDALFRGGPAYHDAAGLHRDYPELRERWDAMRVRQLATLPLTSAGGPVGLLTLVWCADVKLTEAQRVLLGSLAAYTTQALLRAWLLAERTATARTLQEAMVTAELPRAAGVRALARYRPAHSGRQVGGDWYDGLLLGDGAGLFVVGDVTGHDVTASAAMGQLRIALRALAVDREDSPAELLTRVDTAFASLGGPTPMASALVVRTRPAPGGGHLLRWSSAGHPPPVLVPPDGPPRVLTAPADLVLGVDAATARADHDVAVPAGSTLLLYTDGLVERRGEDVGDGIDRVRRAAADLAGEELGEALDALLAAATAEGAVEDDVVVLALRFDDPTGDDPAPREPPYDPPS